MSRLLSGNEHTDAQQCLNVFKDNLGAAEFEGNSCQCQHPAAACETYCHHKMFNPTQADQTLASR